jgi:drug/metabolite transporter (DMT)-like permease
VGLAKTAAGPRTVVVGRRTEAGRPAFGIVLLLGAVVCFAGLDGLGKWINRTNDPLLTAGLRYFSSFVLGSLFLNPWNRPAILRTRAPWLQLARALFLVTATITSFFAVHRLELTQATAISFVSPLIVAVIAGPLLGEWIGVRRAIAVVIGFGGVLVITRPGSGGFQPAMLLAGTTAIANALYSVTTRMLAGRDSSETTMFYMGLVGCAVFVPVVPFIWVAPASPAMWGMMIALGAFGALGHWLLILAHKHAPASLLAPFFYVQLLVASVVGFLVFGEVPDRWTILGGAIVMSSGMYLLYRERVRQVPPSADVAR